MPKLDTAFLDRPLAHRALHDVTKGRPENARASIRAAIDGGYGIEIDLQLSSDGQAMVFHDYALGRLTPDTGPVRQRSSAELARIPLTGGDGETIPPLPQLLDLVAGRVPLLIEIKDQDGAMGTDLGPLEQATASALTDYSGPVAVMSFNPNSVALMGDLAPDIPRGLTTCRFDPAEWAPLPASVCDRLRPIHDYDRVGASFVSHNVADLANPRLVELRAQGADILCWTVTSAIMEARAREIVDNITFEGYLA